MADEVTQEGADKPAQETPNLEEMVGKAVANAVAQVEGKYKNDLAGVHKRNSELEKDLESEKEAHMSDKELAKHGREKAEADLKRRESEVAHAQLELLLTNGLAEAKLSPKLRKLMAAPTDADGLKAWIEAYTDLVKNDSDARVNRSLIDSGGPAPKVGDEPLKPMTEKEVDSFNWSYWNAKPKVERDAAWTKHLEAAERMQQS